MFKETLMKEVINKIYVDGTIRGIISEINHLNYDYLIHQDDIDQETMSTISKVLDGISEKLKKLLEVKK
tara:strand:+ start:1284 stop:1490 length:207 start_codon:yes stop_codon:yes gene_type:complete